LLRPRTTGAPSRDQPRICSSGQTFAGRSTMSGNFFTKVISSAACAFGRARPCSQSPASGDLYEEKSRQAAI